MIQLLVVPLDASDVLNDIHNSVGLLYGTDKPMSRVLLYNLSTNHSNRNLRE